MLSRYNFYCKFKDDYYVLNLINWKMVHSNVPISEKNIKNSRQKNLLLKQLGLTTDEKDELNVFLDKYYKIISSNRLDLTLLTTTSCNFACKYCYESFENYSLRKTQVDVLKRFFENIIQKISSIYLHWFGGEPLLRKNEIVDLSFFLKKLCKSYHKPYISDITTNGFFLDYPSFEKLLNAGVRFYQITIDGDQKTHDFLRPLKNGHGTYNVIINNLIDIRNNAPLSKYFRIAIRHNVSKKNIAGVKRFNDIFDKYFAEDWRFKQFEFPISDWGGENIVNIDKYLFNSDEKIDVFKNGYNSIGKSISDRVCFAAKKLGLSIDPQLNIYKCHHYIQNKIFIGNKRNKLGKILDDGKISIDSSSSDWNSKDIASECLRCDFIPYCLINSCPINGIHSTKNCKKSVKTKISNEARQYIYQSLENNKNGKIPKIIL